MSNTIDSNTKSDPGTTEKVYATSEVARMIGIAPVTVRKYSQSLENKGYVFIRSKVKSRQKARLYRYNDVESLRYLKETREKSNITVDQATSIAIERLGKGAIQGVASSNTKESKPYINQYDELKDMLLKQNDKIDKQSEYMIKQNELIGNLINRIDQQDEYISENLTAPTEQKEIEAPKEIQTLKNSQVYPPEKTFEIEGISAKGIGAYSDIESQKEFDPFFKGPRKTVEKPKENEAVPKESPSRRSKKEKGFLSKLVDKFIIDTRNNK